MPEGSYLERLKELNVQLNQRDLAIAESEVRYRSIVEDQTELICRYNLKGELTFVNGAYCRFFNVKKEDILGTNNIKKFVYEKDVDYVNDIANSISNECPVVTYEHRIVQNDEVKWLRWTDRMLFDANCNPTGEYQSVGSDITELKIVQDTLRRKNEIIEKVFNNSPVPKAIVDTGGIIIDCNYVCLDLFECTNKNEVVGRYMYEFITEDMRKSVVEDIVRFVKSGKDSMPKDMEILTKLGNKKFIEVTLSIIRDFDGEPLYILSIGRDVTDLKAYIAEIKEKNHLLQEMIDKLPHRIFYKDEKSRFLIVNESIAKSFNMPREQIIGKTDFDFMPEPLAKKTFMEEQEIMKFQKPVIEKEIIGKNVDIYTKIPIVVDGKSVGIVGIISVKIFKPVE
jgi:PAS domain S-box-containing protein